MKVRQVEQKVIDVCRENGIFGDLPRDQVLVLSAPNATIWEQKCPGASNRGQHSV
jgi:hypothetical protein